MTFTNFNNHSNEQGAPETLEIENDHSDEQGAPEALEIENAPKQHLKTQLADLDSYMKRWEKVSPKTEEKTTSRKRGNLENSFSYEYEDDESGATYIRNVTLLRSRRRPYMVRPAHEWFTKRDADTLFREHADKLTRMYDPHMNDRAYFDRLIKRIRKEVKDLRHRSLKRSMGHSFGWPWLVLVGIGISPLFINTSKLPVNFGVFSGIYAAVVLSICLLSAAISGIAHGVRRHKETKQIGLFKQRSETFLNSLDATPRC